MKNIGLLISIILSSCTFNKINKPDLELKILTKHIKAAKNHSGINKISYSITNNSNNFYYINNQPGNIKIPISISKNRKFLRVFEESKECTYYPIFSKPTETVSNCNFIEGQKKVIDAKNLGYNEVILYNLLNLDKINFFIFPKQTLFFEYYVSIDKYNNESEQSSIVSLNYNSNKKHYATLFIASDSTNLKKNLPTEILKTIEKNNIIVYHGLIESSNKVPVKLINIP